MNKILSKRIKELLEEKNITQITLASEIGITQATLSRNINGVHEPKADVINKIAEYFGVSADYLLGNTDEKDIQKVIVYDADGTITEMQHKLIDATKGMTTDDMYEICKYVDYIKSKK